MHTYINKTKQDNMCIVVVCIDSSYLFFWIVKFKYMHALDNDVLIVNLMLLETLCRWNIMCILLEKKSVSNNKPLIISVKCS